jgi:hypothetical protein
MIKGYYKHKAYTITIYYKSQTHFTLWNKVATEEYVPFGCIYSNSQTKVNVWWQ